MKFFLQRREAVVFAILVALVLLIGAVNPSFYKAASLLSILNSSLILMLLAIGSMFVILTRGIDVSVGAVMGFTAVVFGLILNMGVALPLAIVVALATGLAAGLINGVGVAIVRVPPIIMTLGALGVYRGLMLVLTGGSWIETIPQSIKSLAGIKLFNGISAFAIFVLALALLTTFLLQRMHQGRYFYAVGDNEEGAYLLGVPVTATKVMAYGLSGFFAAIAAVIFVAQIGFVPMQTGAGQELNAIAAGVLGGVSLSGGVGTPLSAVVGALFLTVTQSALIFLKVPAYWNDAIAGAILLIVVLLDYRIRTALDAQQRKKRAAVRIERAVAVQTPIALSERPLMKEPQ